MRNRFVGYLLVVFGLLFVTGCADNTVKDQTRNVVNDQENEVTEEENYDLEIVEEESTGDDNGFVETVSLLPVGDFEGEATATRIFDTKEYFHNIQANLADPAEDKFYEGWLVKKTPELEFFSTGKLEKMGEKYVLTHEYAVDKADFVDVVVTLETLANGLDNVPEVHVLEGSF